METGLVNVDGNEFAVATGGSGPRLLFLNGSGSSIEQVEPILEFLSTRFEVACHDQRGLGRSAHPPDPWSMADYGKDALGVLDALGWQSCEVLALSFGGMVALEIAAIAPQRIERLALWCTSLGGSSPSYPLHELATLPETERATTMLRLTDRRFSPWWFVGHPSDASLVRAGAPRSVLTERQASGMRRQLEARRSHDVTGRLGDLACDVFVGAGRFDGIAPVANAEAICAEVPHAELHVYQGGHLFFLQDPAAYDDTVRFLLQGSRT